MPVKGTPAAKSRLAAHPERIRLAEAFAIDTVSVLLAAPSVARVLVVTADDAVAGLMRSLGAEIVRETPRVAGGDGDGGTVTFDPLNAAIRQGIDAARAQDPAHDIAVVTGDLPALTVADLETALGLAAAHDSSMVADEEGTGTTMLLARAGTGLTPQFGPGSRAAHEEAGHSPLDLSTTSTARRDVDTVDNLAEALQYGVGRATSALIAATAEVGPSNEAG